MRRKIVLPALLIVAGVYLLAGCLYIPTFEKPQKGMQIPPDQVGDAKSDKPLRVGSATRSDVEQILGLPMFATTDGRQVAYSYRVVNGLWVYPLCFSAEPQTASRALVLSYDADHILRDFRIEKRVREVYQQMPDRPRQRAQREAFLEQRQRRMQELNSR
jgi:hypothetical protein